MKAYHIQYKAEENKTYETCVSEECYNHVSHAVQLLEEREGDFYWADRIEFSFEYFIRNLKIGKGRAKYGFFGLLIACFLTIFYLSVHRFLTNL
jgi:hypothetical protein